MPNVIGQELIPAQNAIQAAGILVPPLLVNIGWPITILWQKSASAPGIVLAQNPIAGVTVAINGAMSLTCSEYPLGVASP